MKFAITGATGFIGVHLIHHLLENGHSLLAVKREAGSLKEFELIKTNSMFPEGYYSLLHWQDCELYDVHKLSELFEGVDCVIHCAGMISYHLQDLNQLVLINEQYTANVVNACLEANVKQLVYISSTAAITKVAESEFLDEEMAWDESRDHSIYGLSKYLGELEVMRGIEEGLTGFVVNPGVVLGYGDWNKTSCQIFRKAARQFPVYAKGHTGFTGVDDLCEVILKLIEKKQSGERYIVVNENASFEQVQRMMARAFGVKEPFIELKGLPLFALRVWVAFKRIFRLRGMISSETIGTALSQYKFNNKKVRNATAHEFRPLQAVIEKAVKGYKNNPPA